MDALYADAEQVYRRSLEIRDQYELRGEYGDGFPQELNDLSAEPYLTSLIALYDFYKEKGWRAPEGTQPILTVGRYPGVSKAGSEVALQACMDTRPSPAIDADGNVVSEGVIYRLELFFKHFDGRLKLFEGSTNKVEQCGLG